MRNQGEFRLSGATPVKSLPSPTDALRGMIFHLRDANGTLQPGYYHVSEDGTRWIKFSESATSVIKATTSIASGSTITLDSSTSDSTLLSTAGGQISLGPNQLYFSSTTSLEVHYNGVEVLKSSVTYIDYNKITLDFDLDTDDVITVKT